MTINRSAPLTHSAERDVVLDGLRAIAILRVVTWHASGWWWTTWIVSSVPVMFVVTGALLGRSMQKSSWFATIHKRFARLLPPLWLYTTLVYVLSVYFKTPTSALWTFFLPFKQPTSAIAGEWFTSALWYVRAYLWVLILAPILYAATRRWGSLIPLAGMVAVFALGVWKLDADGLGWAIGDIVLYTTCTAAGMAWFTSGRPSQRILRAASIVFALSACGWLAFRQPIDRIVNNDHVLHLVIGGLWASLLLQFPTKLTAFSTTSISRFLNRYSLSVYLWHSMIAWFCWQLVPERISTNLRVLIIVSFTFAALPFVIYFAGLFEKRNHRWQTLSEILPRVGLVLSVLLVVVVGNDPLSKHLDFVRASNNQPLPPSAAPKKIPIEIPERTTEFLNSSIFKQALWSDREKQMQAVLDIRTQEMGLGQARAIVMTRGGDTWHGTSGGMKSFDEPSLIGSLTKTFTTSLTMQLAEKGVIDLDDEIGNMGMSFRHGQITIRQLLTHTSGLEKYRSRPGHVVDGTTPKEVLTYLSGQPLRFPPGSYVQYSTAGFAVLGLVLEQKTGVPFEELLRSNIAVPLGYDITVFRGQYKSIGFSTGGISMKMDDLADWSRRYFFDQSTTSSPWDWAIQQTTGLGVHGYCPCTNRSFVALGHMGGRTFASVDGDGTVVVIDTSGVLVSGNYKKTQAFAHELRLIAGGGKTPLYR